MAAPVQVARQQTTPELSGTFWTLASDPIPTLAGTLRNPPELSEPCLWILHQHAPELSGTLQNLPRPSGTNLSEPSGTYLRNLRQHTPEPSGTFRNPAPEPAPAHAGTLRNLPPEPAPATRTSTHRCLSGLKTPLAYAVGEKWLAYYGIVQNWWCSHQHLLILLVLVQWYLILEVIPHKFPCLHGGSITTILSVSDILVRWNQFSITACAIWKHPRWHSIPTHPYLTQLALLFFNMFQLYRQSLVGSRVRCDGWNNCKCQLTWMAVGFWSQKRDNPALEITLWMSSTAIPCVHPKWKKHQLLLNFHDFPW